MSLPPFRRQQALPFVTTDLVQNNMFYIVFHLVHSDCNQERVRHCHGDRHICISV